MKLTLPKRKALTALPRLPKNPGVPNARLQGPRGMLQGAWGSLASLTRRGGV